LVLKSVLSEWQSRQSLSFNWAAAGKIKLAAARSSQAARTNAKKPESLMRCD
jgi:hypothetical protein